MSQSPNSRFQKPRAGRKSRGASSDPGPTQRQLRAGELVRHSLAQILLGSELQDPDLVGVSVTVTEVRMSPDLRHALCFAEPLGAGVGTASSQTVVAALNRAAKYLRGRLGREIDLKFTPELRFVHDESFDEASHINALFARPDVARDLTADQTDDESDRPSEMDG